MFKQITHTLYGSTRTATIAVEWYILINRDYFYISLHRLRLCVNNDHDQTAMNTNWSIENVFIKK